MFSFVTAFCNAEATSWIQNLMALWKQQLIEIPQDTYAEGRK
jgi:hypothetical protein